MTDTASTPSISERTVHLRTCPLCEAMGGLEVHVRDQTASSLPSPGKKPVSLPHGWGHDRPGTKLSVPNEHAGVNTNVLSPGTFVDVLSGNAAVNGIPVNVSPA